MSSKDLIERDECLCTSQAKRQELIVNHILKLCIILDINLDKHIVFTRSVMTLYNLRYLPKSLDYSIKL